MESTPITVDGVEVHAGDPIYLELPADGATTTGLWCSPFAVKETADRAV